MPCPLSIAGESWTSVALRDEVLGRLHSAPTLLAPTIHYHGRQGALLVRMNIAGLAELSMPFLLLLHATPVCVHIVTGNRRPRLERVLVACCDCTMTPSLFRAPSLRPCAVPNKKRALFSEDLGCPIYGIAYGGQHLLLSSHPPGSSVLQYKSHLHCSKSSKFWGHKQEQWEP